MITAPLSSTGTPCVRRVFRALFVLIPLLLTPLAVANPLASFEVRPQIGAGSKPTGVATADFNRDGNVDWAVSHGGDSTVWIFLGDGQGSSDLPTIIPLTGRAPVAIVAADLRRNGVFDLIVAEENSSTIGVLLGNGDGTFQPEREYGVANVPLAVAVDDFDRDGKPDVVIGMVYTPNFASVLAVLPGDGTGKFGSPIYTMQPWNDLNNITYLAEADLNKDGAPDLVIIPPMCSGLPMNGATIFINDGTAHFTRGQVFNFNFCPDPNWLQSPVAVALADIDGDGCIDAAVSETVGLGHIFKGQCNGTVQQFGRELVTVDRLVSLSLRDLDGDGKPELVGAGAGGGQYTPVVENSVVVFENDGRGNFAIPRFFAGGSGMYGLAIADINRDASPDVITSNQNSDSVSVFLNDGHGSFGGSEGISTEAQNWRRAVGDVNGDGLKDVVLLQYAAPPAYLGLATLINAGNARFAPPRSSVITTKTSIPADVQLLDMRGSGSLDAVVLSEASIFVSLNDGAGKFAAPIVTPTSNTMFAEAFVGGDFDHDGHLDLVVVGSTADRENYLATQFLKGRGDGTFTPGQQVPFGGTDHTYPGQMYVGDFNRDGNLDVIVAPGKYYYLFLGVGNGTFSAPRDVPFDRGFMLADVNHDGLLDMISATDSPALGVSVFLGQPDASFKFLGDFGFYDYGYPLDGYLFPFIPGDFDGDGNLDFAFGVREPSETVYNRTVILYGKGDGTFVPSYTETTIYPQFAFDADNDGRDDLATMGWSSVRIIKNVAAPSFDFRARMRPFSGTTAPFSLWLNVPSSSPTLFDISSSDSSITPTTVTVPAGEVTVDFTVALASPFDNAHPLRVTAQSGTESATLQRPHSSTPVYALELSRRSLTFPKTRAKLATAPQTVTVTNIGDGTLPLYVDDPFGTFAQTNDCPANLAPGSSCRVNVVFKPLYAQYETGAIALLDRTTNRYLQNILLFGTGDYPPGPGVMFHPQGLGFDTIPVGSTSAPQVMHVTNVGTTVTHIAGVTSSSPSFLVSSNCGATLAVDATCDVNVRYSPKEANNVGTLTIAHDVPDQWTTFMLFGNASDFMPAVVASPSGSINAGQSASFDFKYTSDHLNPFVGNLSLACSTDHPTIACALSTPSLAMWEESPVAHLTVTTTPRKTALQGTAPLLPRELTPILAGGGAIGVIVLFRRRRKWHAGLACVLILALVACGGGGSGSSGGIGTGGGGGGAGTASGTPSGTHQITVTATVGSAVRTLNVQLNVN